jgi:multidrug efflux pump subunit AcrA (membrane-fusion protein)
MKKQLAMISESTKRVKSGAKFMTVILLSAALAAGCSAAKPEANTATAAGETQVKAVKTAKIEKQKIGDPIEQVAEVVSSIQMDVVLKAGGDVTSILKKRGDYVEQGEVVLRLDPVDILLQKDKAAVGARSAELQLAKSREDNENAKRDAKNGIAKSEAAIKDMEKNYNKLRNDYDLGLVTKFQVEQMETQLNNLRLDLSSAQDKLKTLESTNSLANMEQAVQTANLSIREINRTLENMEVKAPTSGVLTDLPVEVGMTLSPGFKAAQVQKLDPIKIKADLTEAAAELVRGKSELSFLIPGTNEKLKGKVSYMSDVISAQTKSYSIELEVDNKDGKLKPGMKVQVLMTEENDQMVVSVPTLSVVREAGETYVFVLTGDTVEKRKVTLGRLNETIQEVISGVKEGEMLVTSGQHQLKDKEKVQVAK